MGIARTWNGDIANYIQSSVGNWTGGPTTFTCAGWVKVTGALPGDYAFCGRFEPESGSVTDGFRFALRDFDSGATIKFELNILKAGVSTGFGQVANAGLTSWTFVAVVFDSVGDTVKFYQGSTPATVAQVGATQSTTALVGNIGDVRLGQSHHEQSGGAFKYPMDGLMDHWGIWVAAFTLDELILFAAQCQIPQRGAATVVLPIVGASPETSNPWSGTVVGSLPTTTDTPIFTFTTYARCFSAFDLAEYLDTGVNLKVTPAGGAVTCCAWVYAKGDLGNPNFTVFGALNGIGTAGFDFVISNPLGGGQINLIRGAIGSLQASSLTITTAGNFADKAWFVACTIETGVGVHFYAGDSFSTVAEVGNNLTGDEYFPVTDAPDADYTVTLGKNHNGGIGTEPMGGILDQVGLWYGSILTLAQLQLVAAGNDAAPYSSAKFFYKITGASPEPDSSPNASSAVVFSTTLVSGLSPDQGTPRTFPVSNPAVPLPPKMSGGVGGGIGAGTLDYGGIGGLSLDPMGGNAREIEPPSFGTSKLPGGRGGVSIQQKIHPMFRGLDHLATVTRRKK